VTPICLSNITDAFGAFRNIMVECPVPWNIIELFAALGCHAFLENTTTISTRDESNMLGATIYDKIIIFFYTQL